MRYLAADLTAVQITQFTGLNRNTVNRLLGCLRERMAQTSYYLKHTRSNRSAARLTLPACDQHLHLARHG